MGMISVFLLFTLNACVGSFGRSEAFETPNQQSTDMHGKWTWITGDSKTDQRGVYGSRGIAADVNKPGARSDAATWIDNEDNLWLFGGRKPYNSDNFDYFNDLWKLDP